MYGFEALTFNIHGGYLEAIVRGHRSALLTASDYNNLCQCETLEDIKMHLSAIEYGPYLQKWKKSLLLRIEVRSPEEKYGRYFQKTSEKYVATFRRQVWSSLLSRRREVWLSLQFGLPHAFLNGGGLC